MRYSNVFVDLGLIGLFALAPLSRSVGAQQAGAAGRATTVACSQETTRIDGIGERVRLTGECRTVVVSGSGNRVVVERVGSLNVSGMDNEVRWERSLQGEAPRVVTSGIKNVVTRVTPAAAAGPVAGNAPPEKPRTSPPAATPPRAPAPAAPAPPRATAPPPSAPPTAPTPEPTTGPDVPAKEAGRLVVKQSGQTLRLDCGSRQVTVSGSTNTITLTGTCAQLSVTGTGNKIAVERTPRIVTTGHNNEILWQYGEGDRQPSVRTSGMNNTVRRGGG